MPTFKTTSSKITNFSRTIAIKHHKYLDPSETTIQGGQLAKGIERCEKRLEPQVVP
jgi:hypothetical protein